MKFNLTNNEPFEVIRTADDKNVDVLNLKTSDLTNDSGFANWPIVQDKRTSAVAAITADAPFATLTDGQRVTLHLKQDMVNSSTLNLTLSGGTTTGAKSMVSSHQDTTLSNSWSTIKANSYIDIVYESSNNRWVLIGQRDTNNTYTAMSQAEINSGSSTTGRTITPSMLRNNFYTETETNNLLADKENKKLVVNLTLGLTADKTYTEITTAISEGRIVIVDYVNQVRAQFISQDSSANNVIRFIGMANGGVLFEFMVNSSNEWTKTQTTLTLLYDNAPTENSDNIVNSGAIYTALTQVYNSASTFEILLEWNTTSLAYQNTDIEVSDIVNARNHSRSVQVRLGGGEYDGMILELVGIRSNNTIAFFSGTFENFTYLATVTNNGNNGVIAEFGVIPLQNELVSGTSLRTVNNTSLLNSGDIATTIYVPISYNNLTSTWQLQQTTIADIITAYNNGYTIYARPTSQVGFSYGALSSSDVFVLTEINTSSYTVAFSGIVSGIGDNRYLWKFILTTESRSDVVTLTYVRIDALKDVFEVVFTDGERNVTCSTTYANIMAAWQEKKLIIGKVVSAHSTNSTWYDTSLSSFNGNGLLCRYDERHGFYFSQFSREDCLNILIASDDTITVSTTAFSQTTHTHSNYATLASPTFTGTPKAPTAGATTNNTQIATTAFVQTLVSNNALKYTVKAASSSAVSFTTSSKMSPNTVYVVGSVSSSILSFTAINSLSIANGSLSNDIGINWSSNQAAITNNLVVPTYQILFKASSSFSSITLPSSVKWKDSLAPDANDMKNNYCELTIMNGIATMNIVIV